MRTRRDPAWKDATGETAPWHLWSDAVELRAIRAGADAEIVRKHPRIRAILSRAYRNHEPVWMAADEVAFVAKAIRNPRSVRDPRLDKKRLWKEIDADQRKATRAKLQGLRARIRSLRKEGPSRRAAARTSCRTDREATRERIRAIREKHREEARREVREAREGARWRCTSKKREHGAEIGALRAELEAEIKHLRALRTITRGQKRKFKGLAKTSGPLRQESDEEVRANIPPELIPLFDRVRRSIKGSSRKSRTEAFLEYVEEHPGEEIEAIEDKTDALVRELERQQRAGRRDPGRRARLRARFRRKTA